MIPHDEVHAAIEALGVRILGGPHLHTVRARDGVRSWQIARVKCHVDPKFALHVLRASPEQAAKLNGGKAGAASLRFLVEEIPKGVRVTWLSTTGRKRIGGAAHRGPRRKREDAA